jgi:hypothetical protein
MSFSDFFSSFSFSSSSSSSLQSKKRKRNSNQAKEEYLKIKEEEKEEEEPCLKKVCVEQDKTKKKEKKEIPAMTEEEFVLETLNDHILNDISKIVLTYFKLDSLEWKNRQDEWLNFVDGKKEFDPSLKITNILDWIDKPIPGHVLMLTIPESAVANSTSDETISLFALNIAKSSVQEIGLYFSVNKVTAKIPFAITVLSAINDYRRHKRCVRLSSLRIKENMSLGHYPNTDNLINELKCQFLDIEFSSMSPICPFHYVKELRLRTEWLKDEPDKQNTFFQQINSRAPNITALHINEYDTDTFALPHLDTLIVNSSPLLCLQNITGQECKTLVLTFDSKEKKSSDLVEIIQKLILLVMDGNEGRKLRHINISNNLWNQLIGIEKKLIELKHMSFINYISSFVSSI